MGRDFQSQKSEVIRRQLQILTPAEKEYLAKLAREAEDKKRRAATKGAGLFEDGGPA